MGAYSERRQTIRIAVHGNLLVEAITPGQVLKLIDVGLGGFCVQSAAEVPIDVVNSYRFATADRKWSAIFRAQAVHSKLLLTQADGTPQYVSGMTFVNVESPSVQRELMAMMDHAMTFVSFS
jgi:hypothetical protein